MTLTDHVTLNFNNNIRTTAVFLDIEKFLHSTWHLGLLFKLSKLQFSTNTIKFTSSFLSNWKFRIYIEGKVSTPREIQVGVPQGSALSPTLYSLYINDIPNPRRPHSPLRWWHVHIYNRSQRRLCFQKAATRPHFNGVMVWAPEHKNQCRSRPSTSLIGVDQPRFTFLIHLKDRTSCLISYKIPRCNGEFT
jgi:hypothetical protein